MNTSVLRHCREAARPCGAQRRPSFATKWRASFAAAALWLASIAASHAAPAAFSYQGVLRAEDGSALPSKNQTVEFRLYAQAEGGSPIWGRAVAVLLDDAGLFNAELSDAAGSTLPRVPSTPLADALAANKDNALYVGLTVTGSSGEIAPRQRLLPVPYASVASDVSSASGDFSVVGRATAASAQVLGTLQTQNLQTTGDFTVGGDLDVTGEISGFGTIPVGCIILWSGAANEIPEGWKLCNGQNGTPDLRDRFVVGAGREYDVNATGGEKTHTLTVSEMPSHSHTYSYRAYDLAGSWKNQRNFYAVSHGDNWESASTDSAGGGAPHENRPPYYALCYIMRVR